MELRLQVNVLLDGQTNRQVMWLSVETVAEVAWWTTQKDTKGRKDWLQAEVAQKVSLSVECGWFVPILQAKHWMDSAKLADNSEIWPR